ncbi:MAG: hypothetical protein P8Z35_04440, partial [Ignavibacteriaceae bacterium]
MEKKAHSYKLHLLELLSIIFLFSFCIHAQNYNSQDTTKTDTGKIDTSHIKKDTLGYKNILRSNIYSLNKNISTAHWQVSVTDTSVTDTTDKKSDTLGFNQKGSYVLAINIHSGNSLYLLDSSMTDTAKADTMWKKSDSLGYNNIKSPKYSYAFEGRSGSDYYFQYDGLMSDTGKTDTTKLDTLGYNNKNASYYAYNNKDINPTGLNNRTNFLVNPIKDLTQKLKLNVYLMDGQTVKVQKILREYEAKTYQSNGNH